MDSLFGDKGWVSPPAVASSEGPATPSTSISSCPSPLTSQSPSMDNFECQDISSCKPKKRKVEIILESFITDLKNNKDQLKEERRKELLEREEKRLERWKINRAERKQMHKETSEIQKSLVNVLQQLVGQQSNPK
ncbi:hypothetical protein ALC57_08960 [Trachymyrmex cornetzi]|uniref:Uncharacterized protein n=1 Tax=Trachymyrmex cornetzi TaxID=471704 RepID=A0A151J678_9HYME|nr:hypothetical protein ALC57_08960 [Trachymyrmex cornetzi]